MKKSASTKKFRWKKFRWVKVVAVVGAAGSILGLFNIITAMADDVRHGGVILRHTVEGTWTLTTQTEGATESTYTVSLIVNGLQVTGKGLKLGEKSAGGTYTDCNGRACTAFDINGRLDMDGDTFKAWFTEEGERSTTLLYMDRKGKSWNGKFKSEVATSSGPATSKGRASLSPFWP